MKVTRIEQPPDESRTTAQLGDLPDGTLFVRRLSDIPLLKTGKITGTLVVCVQHDGVTVRLCHDEIVHLIGHRPLEWWLIVEKS